MTCCDKVERLEAVLMIAKDACIEEAIVASIINEKTHLIEWERLNYGVLPESTQVAVSWIYSIWTQGKEPEGWKRPIADFSLMAPELQQAVIRALAHCGTLRVK